MTREWKEHFYIAYLFDENVYGQVVQLGAHASLVKYSKDGIEYTELVNNDDFLIREDIVLSFEDED